MSREAVLQMLRFVRRNQHRLGDMSVVDLGWQEPVGQLRDRLIRGTQRPSIAWVNAYQADESELILKVGDGREGIEAIAIGELRVLTRNSNITIWSMVDGEKLLTFNGHGTRIASVAQLSKHVIGSICYNGKLLAWDANSGQILANCQTDNHTYSEICALGSDRLLFNSEQRGLQVWNYKSNEIQSLVDPLSDQDSAKRLRFDILEQNKICTYSSRLAGSALIYGRVGVFDIETGESYKIPVHDKPYDLRFRNENEIALRTNQGLLQLWNFRESKMIAELGNDGQQIESYVYLEDNRIAYGNRDGSVGLWSSNPNQSFTPIPITKWGILALKQAGHILVCATGDQFIVFFDLNLRKVIRMLRGQPEELRGLTDPDANLIGSFSDDEIVRVWDLNRLDAPYELDGHPGWIDRLILLPGERIASLGLGPTTIIWDARLGQNLLELPIPGYFGGVLALDEIRLAAWDSEGTLSVLDMRDGTRLFDLAKAGNPAVEDALLLGKHLLTGHAGGSLSLWNVETGAKTATRTCGVSLTMMRAIDGRRVIIGDGDSDLILVDLEKKQDYEYLDSGRGEFVDLLLMPGGLIVSGFDHGELLVTDYQSRKNVFKWVQGDSITKLMQLDENRFVAADMDGNIGIWDLLRKESTLSFNAHKGPIYGLILLNSRRLASCSRDKTVRIWDVESGNEVANIDLPVKVLHMVKRPGGLALATDWGVPFMLDIAPELLA